MRNHKLAADREESVLFSQYVPATAGMLCTAWGTSYDTVAMSFAVPVLLQGLSSGVEYVTNRATIYMASVLCDLNVLGVMAR